MKTPLQFITVRGPQCSSAASQNSNRSEGALLDEGLFQGNWLHLAQQQRKVRENLEHLEHLGYKVTVMVVTKMTAFSTSRQHSRGRVTTVAVVVVVTKVTAFSGSFYHYHHQNN